MYDPNEYGDKLSAGRQVGLWLGLLSFTSSALLEVGRLQLHRPGIEAHPDLASVEREDLARGKLQWRVRYALVLPCRFAFPLARYLCTALRDRPARWLISGIGYLPALVSGVSHAVSPVDHSSVYPTVRSAGRGLYMGQFWMQLPAPGGSVLCANQHT